MNVSLHTAASAMNANLRWQEVIAENLAASSVPGYKRQEMTVTGVRPEANAAVGGSDTATIKVLLPHPVVNSDFSSGQFRFTGVNTDLGIEGPGFFEVRLPDGTPGYTRDGEFRLDGQGRLVTKQGYEVLGEGGTVQLNPGEGGSLLESLAIAPGGEITQAGEPRGRLRVVEFNHPTLLQPVGGGIYLAGQPELIESAERGSLLRQGWLEQANTSVVTEMADLLMALRAFEANQRVIQMQDERMGKTIAELTPH